MITGPVRKENLLNLRIIKVKILSSKNYKCTLLNQSSDVGPKPFLHVAPDSLVPLQINYLDFLKCDENFQTLARKSEGCSVFNLFFQLSFHT